MLCLVALAAPVTAAENGLARLQQQAMRDAVSRVAPCVVRIETLGGLERVQGMLAGEGPTTGVVVSPQGLVVSSAFNFARKPASILITLPNGQRVAAEIVARDQSRMLVLLKARSSTSLPVPAAVPREEMAVGQQAIAVGRTFDAGQPNVSVGIVSATNRIWGKAVQTDAKVSPSNYGGALIDISGRVLGVLVPLSPDSQDDVAGAEWYDSGIGFAIPLVDIYRQLPRLENGEDLFPGLLGITLKGPDIYASQAEIAAVQPKSPASDAGLQVGDMIVAVDDEPIERQAQLKHALGPKYAGDSVRLVVLRGTERLDRSVTLVDQLLPYEHPFLGILPLRSAAAEQPDLVVRFVYPESGAAKSGIQPGERIVAIGDQPFADAAALRAALANLEPDQKVVLGVERDGRTRQVEVTLTSLPTDVPDSLPPATTSRPTAGPPPVEAGIIDIKIPEESNECIALVPGSYDPRTPHGLVVQLGTPGKPDRDAFLALWRDRCAADNLIVVAPQPQQTQGWHPTEVDFVHKAIDAILSKYRIDRTRVVTYGYQAGGAMALLVAFRHRDLVRGAAVVDSVLPRMRPPDNDPIERLAFYFVLPTESDQFAKGKAAATSLGEKKYPVTVRQTAGGPRPLDDEQLDTLLRWIDTLDRI